MAILPDKILAEAEISSFINRVNVTADEIIGDSKFKIPNPNLPGLGLLIKLQIRALEKSLAASFAPIFIGKKIIEEARERPASFLKIIGDGLKSIGTLFSNPIQFIINEGINNPLEIFPFPIRILFGGQSKDAKRLRELIDNSQPSQGSSILDEYNYNLVLNEVSLPGPGEAVSSATNVNAIKSISVNYQTKTTNETAPVGFLKQGDIFSVSDGNTAATYTVSAVQPRNEFAEIFLQLKTSDTQDSGDNKTILIPGFKNSGIAVSRNINLREFLTSDGRIILPFSVLGINLPLLSKLSFELGNFSNLKDDNPTKEFVIELEARSGLNFNQVFTAMIDGVFPQINFQKLIDEKAAGNFNSQEVAKEEIINLARFLQIGIENPFFLIKIILNYVKLILLPIQLVLGVFQALAGLITTPVSLIRTLFLILTDPLKALCDIISQAFLVFLRPNLEPIIAPILPYNEAVEDPSDRGRGLKPLFSDLICGEFGRKLRNYKANPNFFSTQINNLGQSSIDESLPVQLPFNLEENKLIPGPGEIVTNSNNPAEVTSLRISTITNTVEDSVAFLASVKIGSVISLSVSNQFQTYLVSAKTFEQSQSGNYFQYLVQPTTQSVRSGDPAVQTPELSNIASPEFLATLNIDNPNKSFLFIIENYLPLKLIGVWESIRGILAITIALGVEIPSLLLAVFRSIFGIEQGSDPVAPATDSINELLILLAAGDDSLLTGLVEGNNKTAYAEIISEIIGNNNTVATPGIESIFSNLSQTLTFESKNTVIYKNNINPSVSSEFIYDEISLSKIGENVKGLLQTYYSLKDEGNLAGLNFVNKSKPVGKIYVVRGQAVQVVFNGGVFDAYEKFKVTNAQPITALGTVQVKSLREDIISNLLFVANFLVPALKN